MFKNYMKIYKNYMKMYKIICNLFKVAMSGVVLINDDWNYFDGFKF